MAFSSDCDTLTHRNRKQSTIQQAIWAIAILQHPTCNRYQETSISNEVKIVPSATSLFLAGQATLVHKTTCANAFHADCLLTWTEEHASCPACRRRIRIRPRESHSQTDAWLERRYTVPAIHEAWQKYNIPPPIWFQSLGDLDELAKLVKLADFYSSYMASYIAESLRLRCITTPVRRPTPLPTKIDPTNNSEQEEDDIQSQLGTHHAQISRYWFKDAVDRLQCLSCGYILPTTPSENHLEKHLFGQYFHETREALRLLVEVGHKEAHVLLDRTLGPPMVLRSESGGERVLVHRSSPEAIEAALREMDKPVVWARMRSFNEGL